MGERIKGALPLAAVIGVLAFLWCEFSLNFTFHWFTNGDLGNGLSLPASFHLPTAIAFVAWGFFFAAGADMSAFVKVVVASVIGTVAAGVLFVLSAKTAGFPDFWAIALWVGVLAFVLVVGTALGEWYYVPCIFAAFAANVLWWTATGLDFWAPGSGGADNSLKSLTDPLTAGGGAFSGVLSTPWNWVLVDSLASLLCGCALGIISVTVTAMISPAAQAEEGRTEVVDAPRAHPAH